MVTQGPGHTQITEVSRVETFQPSVWVGNSDRRLPPCSSITCRRDFLSNFSNSKDLDLSLALSLSDSDWLAGVTAERVKMKLRPENISRRVELRPDCLLPATLE